MQHRDIESDPVLQTVELQIVCEAVPTALAKIFGVMCTLNIVPDRAASTMTIDNCVTLSLSFVDTQSSIMDMLQRKISQLTETVTISSAN